MLEQKIFSFLEHVALFYVAMWLLYLFVYRRLDSNVIALTSLVLFSLLMNYITPHVYWFAKNNAGILPQAIFHLSFCVIMLVAMFAIRVIHGYFKLRMSRAALALICLYGVQILAHTVRLAEKALFDTDYLSAIYSLSINAVNIVLCFVCILCIVRAKTLSNVNNEYL
jgi:hypothetical protein